MRCCADFPNPYPVEPGSSLKKEIDYKVMFHEMTDNRNYWRQRAKYAENCLLKFSKNIDLVFETIAADAGG